MKLILYQATIAITENDFVPGSGDDFTEIDLYDFTTYDVPSGEVVDEGVR